MQGRAALVVLKWRTNKLRSLRSLPGPGTMAPHS